MDLVSASVMSPLDIKEVFAVNVVNVPGAAVKLPMVAESMVKVPPKLVKTIVPPDGEPIKSRGVLAERSDIKVLYAAPSTS